MNLLCLLLLASMPFLCLCERPKPNGSTCNSVRPTNGLLNNKIIFYSPSIIGEDTHVAKIDLYTEFFRNHHLVYIPVLKGLGATHVLVGETWSTDGSTAHQSFIDILYDQNLSLIVSFSLPSGKGKLEEQDYQSLRDNRKKDFVLMLKEFNPITRPKAANITKYIYIPPPVTEKMSSKDLEEFYDMVNTLIAITNENNNDLHMMVGIPLSPSDGKIPTYEYGNGDPAFMKLVSAAWAKIWNKLRKVPLFMPMITVDNYDGVSLQENDTLQELGFCQMYNYWSEQSKFKLWGMGIWEFSDEWWRSDLASTGFDQEGCPNGNPYAHTACGLSNWGGDVSSVEYTGLYRIKDIPFKYCISPKLVVADVAFVWQNLSLNESKPPRPPPIEIADHDSAVEYDENERRVKYNCDMTSKQISLIYHRLHNKV